MTMSLRFDPVITNPFALISQAGLIRALMDVQQRWADRLLAIVETYPATRPAQVYIRTLFFKDNWKIIPPTYTGSSIETALVNETPYGHFVVGDDVGNLQNQAYHAGRWYLLRTVVQQSEQQLRQEAQDAINRILAPAAIRP